MSRFKTLLLREWIQHRRGWLLLMLLPPALGLLLIMVSSQVRIEPSDPLLLMLGATAAVTLIVLVLSWGSAFLQAGGLARRDRQDRSIEFWLSLPVGHSASVGATLLAHFILLPLLALAVGFAASQLLALALVGVTSGPTALGELPWRMLAAADVAGVLRLALGVLLASLWLAPFVLATMAASAWLERWGLPALIAALVLGNAALTRLYENPVIGQTLAGLGERVRPALFGLEGVNDPLGWLAIAPRWAIDDAARALRDLADPLMLFALVFSAACFGLLVLRRQLNR